MKYIPQALISAVLAALGFVFIQLHQYGTVNWLWMFGTAFFGFNINIFFNIWLDYRYEQRKKS